MFACNGILFNHESPLRGDRFVTRKITKAVAAYACGQPSSLALGNLEAQRDWGHAADFVKGMWLMLQHDTPDDYVLATGCTTTVRALAALAFSRIGVAIEWTGEGLDEKGLDTKTGKTLITIDEKFFRPQEVDLLIGDASKARDSLGWQPSYTLENLIAEMVAHDLECLGYTKPTLKAAE